LCSTYPTLGFNVLHLMVCVFADCLTAPQLDADLEVGVTHCTNRQEVDQDCQQNIVSVLYVNINNSTDNNVNN
jgi:hypothetical protein